MALVQRSGSVKICSVMDRIIEEAELLISDPGRGQSQEKNHYE